MDNKFDEITEGRWVEEKLSRLEPSAEFQPDVETAFQRLSQREQSPGTPRWARLSMAAALSAIACGVVFALPWHVLWQSVSQPVERPKTNVDSVAVQQPVAPIQIPSLIVPEPISPEPLGEQNKTYIEQNKLIHFGVFGGESKSYEFEKAIAPPPPPPPPPLRPRKLNVGVDGVTQPVVISQVTPGYTAEAKAAKIMGAVELLTLIRADGTAQVREITKHIGYGLDESAVAAVEQWRFSPATKDGEPVEVLTSILVNFTLR